VKAKATERAVKLVPARVQKAEAPPACQLQPRCQQRRKRPLPQAAQQLRDRRRPLVTGTVPRAPQVTVTWTAPTPAPRRRLFCPLPRLGLAAPAEPGWMAPSPAPRRLLSCPLPRLFLAALEESLHRHQGMTGMMEILRMLRMRDALGATAGRCMVEATLRSGRPIARQRATTATSTDQLGIQVCHAAKVWSKVSSAGRTTIPET